MAMIVLSSARGRQVTQRGVHVCSCVRCAEVSRISEGRKKERKKKNVTAVVSKKRGRLTSRTVFASNYLDGKNVSVLELAKTLSDVPAGCIGSWDRLSKSSAKSLPAVACIEREDIPPPPKIKSQVEGFVR